MTTDFEWDNNKAEKNLQKHGVSFAEAKTVFSDPYFVILDDPLHSTVEERFIAIGYSVGQRLLVVVYTERGYNTRIISARTVTNSERKIYEQNL